LALSVTFVLITVRLAGPRQPTYKGRTLTNWVRGMNTDDFSAERIIALRAMGTNATPFLLQWMRYETPSWKVKVFKVTNRVLAILNKEPLTDRRVPLADDAKDAIWILQEQAPTLWTICTNIMLDATVSSNVQNRAYGLLFKRAWGDAILLPYLEEQVAATNAASQKRSEQAR
jgi:hypothetical protein